MTNEEIKSKVDFIQKAIQTAKSEAENLAVVLYREKKECERKMLNDSNDGTGHFTKEAVCSIENRVLLTQNRVALDAVKSTLDAAYWQLKSVTTLLTY